MDCRRMLPHPFEIDARLTYDHPKASDPVSPQRCHATNDQNSAAPRDQLKIHFAVLNAVVETPHSTSFMDRAAPPGPCLGGIINFAFPPL